jgi:hypothetical protein
MMVISQFGKNIRIDTKQVVAAAMTIPPKNPNPTNPKAAQCYSSLTRR